MNILSGPMFEPSDSGDFVAIQCFQCGVRREGAHYNIFQIKGGMGALRKFFPNGKCDDLNIILFSTSGVHGTYTTLETIEDSLKKYPESPAEGEDWPDDYNSPDLTVLIIQPRIVCLRYGCVTVTLDDVAWLKGLRASAAVEMAKIGMP